MRPVRVDLLTPCFWPEVRRGTERFTRELADGLLAAGHRPRLITSHPSRRPTRSTEDGLPIVRVPRPPEGRLVRRRFESHLTHLPLSYAVLRAGDAQIAHAMAPGDAAMASRWSAHTGRPAVFSHMGVPDHADLMLRRKRLEIVLEAVQNCAATVVLSRYARDEMHRWLGHEARVIAPPVNLDRFPLGTERTEEPTIVCSAALDEPRKRVALLVEAFALVRREHSAARLLLNRPRDPAVAAAFDGPGVELTDMDDPATLASLNGRAWAAALPSFGEAFGLVLVEAMATGTPAVGAAHGAFPEIVDRPEVGALFEGDDPAALADALLRAFELAREPATRAACRSRAGEFSTRATTAAYEALYSELV